MKVQRAYLRTPPSYLISYPSLGQVGKKNLNIIL